MLNPLEKNVRGANQRIDIICITERYKKKNTLKSHQSLFTPPFTNHTNGGLIVATKSNLDTLKGMKRALNYQIKRNKCNVINLKNCNIFRKYRSRPSTGNPYARKKRKNSMPNPLKKRVKKQKQVVK